MRCSDCRTNISPGPEFCPACGGDLDITAKELIGWSFRSVSRRLSVVTGWTLAFAGMIGVSLLGSQIELDDTPLTAFVLPEPPARIAEVSDPATPPPTLNAVTAVCDGDCEAKVVAEIPTQGYVLRRRTDLPVRSEAEREKALQIRGVASVCVATTDETCVP